MRCLNCGNKAKRDCLYYRCRSCCRGHGFQCQTHVKSTWVPISTRQSVRKAAATMEAPSSSLPPHQQQDQQLPTLPSSSSSGFGGHFPDEVTGETTFTCVRVTLTSDENAPVDQYAYETSINIRGNMFRGILYDQGPLQLTPTNFRDLNVDDEDHRDPTINIQSNLHLVNNPMPSSSSTPPS